MFNRARYSECPFCKSFVILFPNLATEWDYNVNGNLNPWNFTPGSNIKVGWKCKCCGHKWNAVIYDRTEGHGCPECSVKQRSGSNHYNWNPNREEIDQERIIRKHCTRKFRKSPEVQEYLSKFPNWEKIKDNYHLDHIFPVKAFIEYGILDINIINDLSNLQPLSPEGNRKKSDNYHKQEFYLYLKNKYGDKFLLEYNIPV